MRDLTGKRIGIVGLGRMGGGLAHRALAAGIKVVGHGADDPDAALLADGLAFARDLRDLAATLPAPRTVLIYVPAGEAVDAVVDGLLPHLAPGDVVADGGNSYWGDSVRCAERLAGHGVDLVDLGTSGGVPAAGRGYCFMGGGRAEAWARLAPTLTPLAVPGGIVHAGPSGAGHYAKLVHNGIEFAMLQAVGEGYALLEGRGPGLDVPAILECWRHGSVIRSWLVDLIAEAVEAGHVDDATDPHVEDTGEVNWLLADALAMEVPTPAIATAVQELLASRDGGGHAWKAVARMREGFGGHPIGPDDAVAAARRTARRGPFVREAEPFAEMDGPTKATAT
jgi:6-phosphogluconate dehydrogenase